MKTPEKLANDFCKDKNLSYSEKLLLVEGFKAGFEIGSMKGAMQMQAILDDDYHFTPKKNEK